jgi:hypothetical protein
MNIVSWYHIKLFIAHASGISMDALHIMAGVALFLIAARLFKRGARSFAPWLALLLLELANEAYDFHVELWPSLASQFGEAAKDILLTMTLPTLMLSLARWRPEWLIGPMTNEPSQ